MDKTDHSTTIASRSTSSSKNNLRNRRQRLRKKISYQKKLLLTAKGKKAEHIQFKIASLISTREALSDRVGSTLVRDFMGYESIYSKNNDCCLRALCMFCNDPSEYQDNIAEFQRVFKKKGVPYSYLVEYFELLDLTVSKNIVDNPDLFVYRNH